MISMKDAKRFLAEYKRVDIAVDAFYNEPVQARQASIPQPSTSKLNALFDKYKGEYLGHMPCRDYPLKDL